MSKLQSEHGDFDEYTSSEEEEQPIKPQSTRKKRVAKPQSARVLRSQGQADQEEVKPPKRAARQAQPQSRINIQDESTAFKIPQTKATSRATGKVYTVPVSDHRGSMEPIDPGNLNDQQFNAALAQMGLPPPTISPFQAPQAQQGFAQNSVQNFGAVPQIPQGPQQSNDPFAQKRAQQEQNRQQGGNGCTIY